MNTRWKPDIGDRYWNVAVSINGLSYYKMRWRGDSMDRALYASNNCFKTREQASAVLEKIKQVLMEVHDDA